ncbi:replication factor A [Nitzschia inconspicua]|uniref:Replication factor A n=1 Tax=Nitzschia inconspicua TaxID=303405 RepID=A0A9K3M1B3_9STRA|nr:replication factor A [Nitzschia inconspicua]
MYNRTNVAGNSMNAGASSGINPYSSPNMKVNPYSSGKRPGSVDNGAIVHHASAAATHGGPKITPTAQLIMYQNRFTICARVCDLQIGCPHLVQRQSWPRRPVAHLEATRWQPSVLRVSVTMAANLLSGGDIHIERRIPETEELHEWWTTQGSSGGALRDLCPVPVVQAHLTFIKNDKKGGAWYTACPNKEDPCRNRCKITETIDGNSMCERCHGTYPNCTRKWIFSATVGDEETASSWVFDEQAQQMLGVTADETSAQFESQDVYNGYFARALITECVFKCRVKNEIVNDGQ